MKPLLASMRRQAWLVVSTLCLTLVLVQVAQAQTVTELLRNGPNAEKFNLVIIGDGFTAGADQTAFNTFVQNTVIRDLFSETRDGAYREIAGAFNIFRVNANSAATGVTAVDNTGAVTNAVNTFLGYRYSGMWGRCWMEPGPNSNTTLVNTLNNLVPGWTHVFIVLNTTNGGGCRRSNQLAITMGGGWAVAAHEMGHMIGDLGDEYTGTANYTGGDPGKVNLSNTSNRNSLKWAAFVNPSTAVPTPATTGDPVEDAGAYSGGTFWNAAQNTNVRYGSGIFRPSSNSRMNSNAPEFDSIGYNQMRSVASQHMDNRYRNVYAGRFTGRSGSDVVVHQENTLTLYTGQTNTLAPTWVRTLPDPVWDAYRPGDRFLVGDFDGDGKQDLFVYNFTNWNQPYFAMLRATGSSFEGVRRFDRDLPGWGEMKPGDQFMVADVDGDGKDDLIVFNGRDFNVGYLLVLRSTGNDLQFVRRYDDTLPGWGSMKANDQFFVANFNTDLGLDFNPNGNVQKRGRQRADLFVSNQRDWSMGYLLMLSSNGRGFDFVRRFDQTLPGWGDMKPGDQFFVGDFNGDKRSDLYVFNGSDWSMPYLEMLSSNGSNLQFVRRFDRDVPGWGEMRRNDRWTVADINGDGKSDLYVYNAKDWNTQYLGSLLSNGGSLSGSFQSDWIGSWNLGPEDQFLVCNFNGGAGWDDLLVYNDGWFGLLRSLSNRVTLTAIYPQWIHNHRYHDQGWW
jgi:IgA Peptidase M64/FG-GAP-like repeat